MSITSSPLPVARPDMFGKILITIAVIVICMGVLANRAAGRSRLREIPNPEVERRKRLLLQAALAFMFVMVVAAGVIIYLEVR